MPFQMTMTAEEAGKPASRFEVVRLRDSLGVSGSIFDRQLRDRAWAPTIGTESLTSTAIALIGLGRAGVAPSEIGMDPGRTWEALMALARRHRYAGATGLLLWADAVGGGPGPEAILSPSSGWPRDVGSIIGRLRTLELAWLLSGLIHAEHRRPSGLTKAPLGVVKAALIGRFEAHTRTFRHAEAGSPPSLRVRRWVATFADQIYPIQALALAAIAEKDGQALEVASASAGRMVELQGDRGQWWWHFDPRDGSVSGAYPVYSVHQVGMAPMALKTLALAGGPDFAAAIEAGRGWVSDNELGIDLVDDQAGTIWRSIEKVERFVPRLVHHARGILGGRDDRPGAIRPKLRVNHETRPYEWAWGLFAAAIESGPTPSEHLA